MSLFFIILLSFLIPVLTGFFLVSLIDREMALRFRVLFSIPIGFGVHSIFYFLYQYLNIYNFKNFEIFEGAVVLGLAICYYNQERPNFSKHKFEKLNNWFYVINVYAIAIFAKYFINNPMGSWDGFRIWNTKAEFLFLQSPLWKNVFHLPHFMSHCDYPMFLPSSVARLWNYVGEQNFYMSVLLGAIFTFALVYLLYQAIRYFKSEKTAYIVCTVFAISDIFLVNGAAQCADIPLAMFFLSSIVCLFLYFKWQRFSTMVLALILAGLGAWVKNEGMMFFLIFASVLLGWFAYKKEYKYTLYTILCSIPVLACYYLYKKFTGAPNDLVLGLVVAKSYKFALEPMRYLVVLNTFLSMLLGRFVIFLSLIILCLKGFKVRATNKDAFLISSLIFCGCALGYIAVYIIAPHDITWLVENSMERIILQILPVFLFLFALSLRIGKPDTIN